MHLDWGNLIKPWELYLDHTLWERPVMFLPALDPAWMLTLALSEMHIVTLCNVQHGTQVRLCHPVCFLTITVNHWGYTVNRNQLDLSLRWINR